MTTSFEVGRQPCDKFKPQDDLDAGMGNEHQCPLCLLTRSFCLNCNRDHHYKGWDCCDKVKEAYAE